MMAPYYQDDLVTLYHGNALQSDEWLAADVLVSDVPYGIDYNSGRPRETLDESIEGDKDPATRDAAIEMWRERHGEYAPAIIFGTWRIPRPEGTRALLVWDTKGALGMGDLSIPWKPSHQEMYVLGRGFHGTRSSDVITCAPVQSTGRNGRVHPHQKPVALMEALLEKCPAGVVADPFSGSGSTLIAARNLGRRAIGFEISEKHCATTVRRLGQQAFNFEAVTA